MPASQLLHLRQKHDCTEPAARREALGKLRQGTTCRNIRQWIKNLAQQAPPSTPTTPVKRIDEMDRKATCALLTQHIGNYQANHPAFLDAFISLLDWDDESPLGYYHSPPVWQLLMAIGTSVLPESYWERLFSVNTQVTTTPARVTLHPNTVAHCYDEIIDLFANLSERTRTALISEALNSSPGLDDLFEKLKKTLTTANQTDDGGLIPYRAFVTAKADLHPQLALFVPESVEIVNAVFRWSAEKLQQNEQLTLATNLLQDAALSEQLHPDYRHYQSLLALEPVPDELRLSRHYIDWCMSKRLEAMTSDKSNPTDIEQDKLQALSAEFMTTVPSRYWGARFNHDLVKEWLVRKVSQFLGDNPRCLNNQQLTALLRATPASDDVAQLIQKLVSESTDQMLFFKFIMPRGQPSLLNGDMFVLLACELETATQDAMSGVILLTEKIIALAEDNERRRYANQFLIAGFEAMAKYPQLHYRQLQCLRILYAHTSLRDIVWFSITYPDQHFYVAATWVNQQQPRLLPLLVPLFLLSWICASFKASWLGFKELGNTLLMITWYIHLGCCYCFGVPTYYDWPWPFQPSLSYDDYFKGTLSILVACYVGLITALENTYRASQALAQLSLTGLAVAAVAGFMLMLNHFIPGCGYSDTATKHPTTKIEQLSEQKVACLSDAALAANHQRYRDSYLAWFFPEPSLLSSDAAGSGVTGTATIPRP